MRTDFRPLFSLKTFFKKSYELPLTMATENAGHSVLTESNGAIDFTTDLRERPEPDTRGFGRSSPSLGANTLVAHDDLSDENQSTPQTPLFSQRYGPASTLSTAPAAATDEAQWEGLE